MKSLRCSNRSRAGTFRGAADARIANWRSAERGLSTETFLFDLQHDGDEGPFTGDFALAGFCVERIRQLLD